MQTSSEIAHAEDYRINHAIEQLRSSQCIDCKQFCSTTRYVAVNRVTLPLCRDCRTFDHPCDCGKGECLPGTQECLACCIDEDLRPMIRARFARALFHVAGGLMLDKIAGGVQ